MNPISLFQQKMSSFDFVVQQIMKAAAVYKTQKNLLLHNLQFKT